MTEIDTKNKIIKGFYWLTSLTFIGQLITWFITIIVIRLLEPKDYGIMAMSNVFMNFLVLFNEIGLSSAIIQKKNLSKIEIQKSFGIIVLVNVLLTYISYFIAPLIGIYFSEVSIVQIIRVLSINFILSSLFIIPQSMLLRELDYRRKSVIDLFANLSSCLLVFTLASFSFGVWALVFGMLGLNIVKVFGFNFFSRKIYRPIFDFDGIRKLLIFGGHVSASRLLWYFYSQADIIIGGRVLGKMLLGYYSVPMNLVSIPLNKMSPLFIQLGIPTFSNIQEDNEAIQYYFLKIIRMINILSFPGFIGCAIIAPVAVPTILGQKWLNIVLPLQLLCTIMPLRFISIISSTIITGIGRPDVNTGNMIYCVIIMPIAFYLGSHWGINGLCFSWVIAYPILFIIMMNRIFKILSLPLIKFIETIKYPICGSIIMVIGLSFINNLIKNIHSSYFELSIKIVSGLVMYLSSLLIINKNEINDLKNFFIRSR